MKQVWKQSLSFLPVLLFAFAVNAYAGQSLSGKATDFTLKSRDRKSTRLNSSHIPLSRMPSSA